MSANDFHVSVSGCIYHLLFFPEIHFFQHDFDFPTEPPKICMKIIVTFSTTHFPNNKDVFQNRNISIYLKTQNKQGL